MYVCAPQAGKGWIFTHTQTTEECDVMAKYLMRKCVCVCASECKVCLFVLRGAELVMIFKLSLSEL